MNRHTLIVGSANKDKCREIKKLLSGLRVNVVSVSELGPVPKVVEDGKTFAENACKKAMVYSKLSSDITLADDSGLCVKALKGRPGICSARFAGPGCTYDDNNRKMLRLLFRKPPEERGAHFNCTVALYRKGKKIKVLKGVCEGSISEEALGDRGFGFDPLFVPEGENRTFGQMSEVRKNEISHRGEALQLVREFLEEYFEKEDKKTNKKEEKKNKASTKVSNKPEKKVAKKKSTTKKVVKKAVKKQTKKKALKKKKK